MAARKQGQDDALQQLYDSVRHSTRLAQRPVEVLQSLSQGTHDSVDLRKLLELLLELRAATQCSADLVDKLTLTQQGSDSASSESYEIVQAVPPYVPVDQPQLGPSHGVLQPPQAAQTHEQPGAHTTQPLAPDAVQTREEAKAPVDEAPALLPEPDAPLQVSHPASEPLGPELSYDDDDEAPLTLTPTETPRTGSSVVPPAITRVADETIMEAPLEHKPIEVVIVSNAHENYIQSRRDSKAVVANAVAPRGGSAHIWLLYRVTGPAGEKFVALQNEANGKWLSADKGGALRCDRPWMREWEMWSLVPMATAQDGRTDAFALSLFGLRSFHGQYLCVEAPGTPSLWPIQLLLEDGACKVVANRDECDAWERLVFMSPDGTCSAAFQRHLRDLAV